MSSNPNDPFDQQPVEAATVAEKPRKRKGCIFWVVILIGGMSLMGVCACCGGGYWVLNFLTNNYQQQLAGNPVIVEQIGEIESMSMNFSKTGEERESNPNASTFAFDIQGSESSGTILIRQDQSGDGLGIESAVLILSDGTRVDVPIGDTGSQLDSTDEDFQIDLGELDADIEELKESLPAE